MKMCRYSITDLTTMRIIKFNCEVNKGVKLFPTAAKKKCKVPQCYSCEYFLEAHKRENS